MSSLSSVESRDEVLLRSLRKYYADAGALRALTEVLRSTAKVSLRTLDWLVTNYAKKHNTVYHYNGKAVNVFLEYKGCLKAFSKRCFDPFQRRGRIEITDADGRPMQSTTGQLNFFRFAISMGVVRYAQQHATAIEADMLQAIRHRAAGKTPTAATAASSTTATAAATETKKPKRKELSRAAVKTATATDIKVTVRFI